MSALRIVKDLDELNSWVGKEVVVSNWLTVDLPRIRAFAEVTGDHQWIHIDAERCRRESPYKAPIAHGYLILSLLPTLFENSLRIEGLAMAVNYGLDRVRLPAPVIAGSRIRGRIVLDRLEAAAGGLQAHWTASVEIEAQEKPACVAQMLVRYYPLSTPR